MQSDDPKGPSEAERVQRALRLAQAPPPALAARLAALLPGVPPAEGPAQETPLDELRFAVLDFETTGLHDGAEIIEIGVCDLHRGRVESTFSTLVRPRGPIPIIVAQLTGIDEETVQGAPELDLVFEAFEARLTGRVLVAHNAAFDVGILDAARRARGRSAWSGPILCTRALARRLRPDLRRRNLDDLCAAYDIPNRARHRALGDAEATARLFTELCVLARGAGAASLADLCALSVEAPPPPVDFTRYAFGPARLAHLPRGPGVYRMLDRSGAILYVGKSRDLQSRVRSYFTGRARGRVAALREALYDLEITPTDSEIEALLLEARDIRALRPPFNVQVQIFRRAFFLRISSRAGRPRVVAALEVRPDAPCYGPFVDPLGGREVARRLREALGTAGGRGLARLDAAALLGRAEGADALLQVMERALAERNAASDPMGADDVRLTLSVLRRLFGTITGPRSAHHRRDLVVRLPSAGAPRLFLLREGRALEVIEAADPEAAAERIGALLAAPAPDAPLDDDGLKLLDAWLARNPAGARLDLGDVTGPADLRTRLAALLALAPPVDVALLAR